MLYHDSGARLPGAHLYYTTYCCSLIEQHGVIKYWPRAVAPQLARVIILTCLLAALVICSKMALPAQARKEAEERQVPRERPNLRTETSL